MKLTSSSFIDHGLIPMRYTCDGENISPPLVWDEVPPETVSLSLIMDDPDAPGKTFVHWVVYDIPPTINQLSENIITSQHIPGGGIQGKNDFNILGYGGPCPPSGIHRYFFHLYALDKQLNFSSGVTKNDIMVAMKNHVLAKAQLMGKYQRQR
ncbi:YbhB/YbcL family Raf kinase inhibitor-like protein [Cylindrospermopsis curvispora]|uniref:YbhB/YbcL family Raf kinase inhibitor-like protein n=1 Tax=Cylindrospermopsis curvispora GIHE-G1 TaxID=2666332 RepID=A0A7H0F0S0_9CYAN|nr:YbhB/YbcL family Raf kinase inhibitor-like protein [Cylindrospermopsis curvispora]QNP29636.1 YbhB/YbcL family Raf kinase inhibitor-like protein [Cylindrospermopsis curvispora GIHE-G1]